MAPEPEQQQAPPRQRHRPETSDVVGTVVLGVIGLVAVVMGLGYGFTAKTGQVGPGFLPVLTGAFIVLATLLELARMFFATSSPVQGTFMEQVEKVEEAAQEAIVRAHQHDGDAGADLDTFGRTRRQRGIATASIFGLMLLAILLVPVLGLLLSLTLMTLVLLLVVERKPVLPSVLATAAGLGFFYLTFVQGLHVPLPTGLLGLI